MIRIGLDAMGGDFAPEVVVKGAVMALGSIDKSSRIVLYGDANAIRMQLAKEGCAEELFDIVPTSEVIEMGDHPVRAFQQKRDSSIVVGFQHLAEGKIDGFASAGSTGAIMVGSTQVAKVIEGVIRPAISTVVPTITGTPVMILDVGLNVDCRPDILEQYALIGSIYAESVLGVKNPRVALLNIGAEATKGNFQSKEAYELLQVGGESGRYNFVGNVEASHIFTSKVADVVVCDGFVGNTILKLCEGLYAINDDIGTTNSFLEGLNYENIGGTPVLGINAPVIIGHGKSTAQAIKSMILSTEQTIRARISERLSEAFK
ncbi:MAG: phosphate acyltransferase [Alistipes sp.]|nr:phosphate acyltransferase [Alistipes sp.]